MQEVVEAEVSKVILADLYADLKGAADSGGIMEGDAFRYEMFARRLVAAEYGRQDAVKWALEWHTDLIKERAEKVRAMQEKIDLREAENAHSRSEFLAGRVGNPLYQAFLDTVENPADVKNNVDYFAFHSEMLLEFQKSPCGLTFLQFLRNYADQHLSERVKSQAFMGGDGRLLIERTIIN
jgi:hypothetical protein